MMAERKDYSLYDTSAFAADQNFQDWVLKGNNDEYWQDILNTFPDKKEEILRAKQLLTSIRFSEHLPQKELVEASLQKSLEAIDQRESKGKAGIMTIRRWWAAAAAVILLVAGTWVYRSLSDKMFTSETTTTQTQPADLPPGGNKAILTLADGSQIILDTTPDGQIADEGSITVIKLEDGMLAYQESDKNADKTTRYNTITTPQGGQYQLTLADGTKVWLNAQSSLRFPTAFNGTERRVELTGEGYFEVAKNKSKPFYVTSGEMSIKALGTEFNINAYGDNGYLNTTLIEGSVEVATSESSVIVIPGQQVQLNNSQNKLRVINNVDLDQVVAWKNGYFSFDGDNIESIMNNISRWYGVKVVYSNKKPDGRFSGIVSRQLELSKVLYALELNGISYELKDRTIYIK